MIAQSVNVYCPSGLKVRKYYYFIVHLPNKTMPVLSGCDFCVPNSNLCQNCSNIVFKYLQASLAQNEIVPDPIRTELENVSDLLQD